MTRHEEWRPIVGYEGAYEVSDRGQVRSLAREVYAGGGRTRKHLGRTLSIYTGDHYSKVRLKLDGDGGKTHNVHSIVAAAFIGPVPEGMEVCHYDDDGHNNCIENLRYDDHRGNIVDREAHRVVKTECKNGHPFDEENTRIGARGTRECRACQRELGARQRAAEREAAGRVLRSERTECKYGHPLDGVGKRQRFCTTCSRASAVRYYQRKKAERESVEREREGGLG